MFGVFPVLFSLGDMGKRITDRLEAIAHMRELMEITEWKDTIDASAQIPVKDMSKLDISLKNVYFAYEQMVVNKKDDENNETSEKCSTTVLHDLSCEIK